MSGKIDKWVDTNKHKTKKPYAVCCESGTGFRTWFLISTTYLSRNTLFLRKSYGRSSRKFDQPGFGKLGG
ncbi:MAG: hypothetical protein OHK0037_20800 [Elainellaceae cyanobacterium]